MWARAPLAGDSGGTWTKTGFNHAHGRGTRDALQRLMRRRGAGQAAVMRAQIVLTADAEPQTTNKAIAAHLGIRA